MLLFDNNLNNYFSIFSLLIKKLKLKLKSYFYNTLILYILKTYFSNF